RVGVRQADPGAVAESQRLDVVRVQGGLARVRCDAPVRGRRGFPDGRAALFAWQLRNRGAALRTRRFTRDLRMVAGAYAAQRGGSSVGVDRGRVPYMRFSVVHTTRYRYDAPVHLEPHTFRLRPRQDGAQQLLRHSLVITPSPAGRADLLDREGNVVTQ